MRREDGKGAPLEPEGEKQQSEEDDIERKLERGNLLHSTSVHRHKIDGVGKGREEHQQEPGGMQRHPVVAPIKQCDAPCSQDNAHHGEQAHSLMKQSRHDDRHQYGVDEQECRGDGGTNVEVAHIERE